MPELEEMDVDRILRYIDGGPIFVSRDALGAALGLSGSQPPGKDLRSGAMDFSFDSPVTIDSASSGENRALSSVQNRSSDRSSVRVVSGTWM
jgi:hypothetical protein